MADQSPTKSPEGKPLRRLGKYQLLKELGRGGMGQVYEAVDTELDRHIALKVLPAMLGKDEDFVTRFRVEAKSAARLNHPNIVTIFSVGQDRGTHFMAMELVPGQDLADRVHAQKRIPEDQALPLLMQAIQGLEHAWAHGIIHRDLKPSNLMVNSQGILKILDFGVARCSAELATRMTLTGSGVGTPRYMPPEQARNAKDVDLRADIYSLGATFYHILTGQTPFDGESAIEVVMKIATSPVPPIRDINPDISPRVATVVEKMLSREPEKRYSSAGEMLVALSGGDKTVPLIMPSSPLPPLASSAGFVPVKVMPSSAGSFAPSAAGSTGATVSDKSDQFINSVGMKFALIKPGEFIMGSPEREKGHAKDETLHRVGITRRFYISICPVTQREFDSVVGNNPSHFRGFDLPVEQVSWWDAMEFCLKLKATENRTYRLPTEAEWEYACRASTTTAFSFGDDDEELRDYAWYCINSGGSSKPVGRKEPNTWGIHDMHGNVFEWCADWHGYYMDDECIDPIGPSSGPGRIFRGGSWNLTPNYCRSALRNYRAPAYKHRNVGFRVVMAVEEDPAK